MLIIVCIVLFLMVSIHQACHGDSIANCNLKSKGPCNQCMYDLIYKNIIQIALDSKLTQKDIDLKNKTIENLRVLCNNQLSTYETGRNR
jgi:hypothetical protein